MYRVGIDNCFNGRLFDDDTHPKIKAEADAIRRIINDKRRGGYVIIGSFAVEAEMAQITNDEKRRAAEKQYKKIIDDEVKISVSILTRAAELESKGLKTMDARHLAAAEEAGADFLLTTDERFIRKCAKNHLTWVNVINPIDFERR